ncbi:hypothetical protein [Plantibacter sp. CFBP 8775]|uniref:hypothetical protein n=1 Tax=Plantibacter sp. CFBP 8775 TaxID=2774038 RepID=UPI001783617F|nr:hypothetical protein [Plantibacter sp. CFBP 8775]MBD8103982.1 hypothetical protein [Plantibacter sp. CFBP 8775]
MSPLINQMSFKTEYFQAQADGAVEYYADQEQAEAALRDAAPQTILKEKELIDSLLQSGRQFVANRGSGEYGPYVIHAPTCSSIRHQIDRDEAWAYWLADQSGRSEIGAMPNLLDRRDVEALPTYRACLVCNPDDIQREKKRTPSSRPTLLGSITRHHLGRSFVTIEEKLLGVLLSFTVAPDRVSLNFAAGDFAGGYDLPVIMLPKQALPPSI